MLVKRIIPSLSVQDGPVKNDVWLVSSRMDRQKTRTCNQETLEHLNESLSEGLSDGTLGTSIFHDGTFTVADAKNYFVERGLSVRPAPRTLQPREMS